MKSNLLIEAISEAKSPESLNEDGFFISGNIFGVFDGATGLDSFKDIEGKTGGYLASSTAVKVFREFGNNLSLKECAIKTNECINDSMRIAGIDLTKKEFLWSTSAAVVKINQNNFEWLGIGDSSIVLIYTDNSFKVLYYYNHDQKSLELLKNMVKNQKVEEDDLEIPYLRTQILPIIIKTRQESNINYGVINGEKSMIKFLHTGIERLDNIQSILIFSDGLIIPTENPEIERFDQIVSTFLVGGLQMVLKHVRELENSDLSCSKYIRLKPHDDATGISISMKFV